MQIKTFGNKRNKLILMLSGSFCNSSSMEYLFNYLLTEYYLIIPEYNGHYPNSSFTTRENEAREIIQYLRQEKIQSIDIIYGQSMGTEIGIELIYQMIQNGLSFKTAFFDGAPCIKYSTIKIKFMNYIFRKLINMIKNNDIETILNSKFIKSFSNNNPNLLKNMVESMKELAPLLTKETIRNECKCCYTFNFPLLEQCVQEKIYFIYGSEEKAYKSCYKKIRKAYPYSKYEIINGYGHLTYSVDKQEEYIKKLVI